MESTAAWAVPYEPQQGKNWTTEVAPADDAQVWAPAVGHPLQYASLADIFGPPCSLQPYVVPASCYSSGGQQAKHQLVEHNYYNYNAAAAQHHDPDPTAAYVNRPRKLFEERKEEFEKDAKLMKTKMHRYPPSIQALGDSFTVPKFVAIGPYYHHRDHLQEAENMKHVAAHYCIEEYERVNNNNSGLLEVQDMYDEVVSVAAKLDARGLYHKDVMAGIGDEDDFLPMMFYDACFLVMYIFRKSGMALDLYLYDFFESNDYDIAHDIMLLENQIPLQVVHAVMSMCTAEPIKIMKEFIANWWEDGFLLDRYVPPQHVDWDQEYYNEAPHLLGLLRFYAVGKRRRSSSKEFMVSESNSKKREPTSISADPMELAEMGILFRITANKTLEIQDMRLARKWFFFAELSMAPLCLSDTRASWLVNMAALELCTTPDFFDQNAEFQDSAVCSYLRLLCMLMHREEDVHELRTKGILRGGGVLTNKKTLNFFNSLHSLREGRYYVLVTEQIKDYKNYSSSLIKVQAFLYRNWKYVVAVASGFAAFMGIFVTLMKLKGAH